MKTIAEILEDGTPSYCSPTHAAKMYADGNCPFNVVESAVTQAIEFYAKQQAIAFADWLAEMTTVVMEEKIPLYRYCDQNNQWGNYILDDIYLEWQEHLKRSS